MWFCGCAIGVASTERADVQQAQGRWPHEVGVARRTGLLLLLLSALLVPLVRAQAASAAARVHESRAARLARPITRARGGISLTPSTTQAYWSCPHGECEAIVAAEPVRAADGRWLAGDKGPPLEGGGEKGGLDPADLQAAYGVSAATGAGQTVALVEAFGYKVAEKDLDVYRSHYGLPACTKANGCLRKVNHDGEEANYPRSGEKEWEEESGLDLDMVSAVCPECKILLVEAEGEGPDLPPAVREAAALGANEISNSYSFPEEQCWEGERECEAEGADYDIPGVIVTAAAGDTGLDSYLSGRHSTGWPASLPWVVSVGGTTLHRSSDARGWSAEAWFEPEKRAASGGGCSREPKPAWQTDGACAGRMDNDVAADAACRSGVSVYGIHGWRVMCGSSAAAPLAAGIAAHYSQYARSLEGGEAFYLDPSALTDITTGHSGECTPPASDEYFCHAGPGYDGPTGNGTPFGAIELAQSPPSVSTGAASALGGGSATLAGTLDAQGSPTTYSFEYGTTTGYGSSVPLTPASAGSTSASQPVSETVTGLQAASTYHYRLTATNADGTSYGPDRSFSTSAPQVEAVSPAQGAVDEGASVTISGTGLAGASAVYFGSNPSAYFQVESEDTILATAPVGDGAEPVTVTTPAGTSAAGPDDSFDYVLGPVLSWGKVDGLQRARGTPLNALLPAEAPGLESVTALAAGREHGLALLQDGAVMSWGAGGDGEVGDGSTATTTAPVHVCALGVSSCPAGPYLEDATAVAAGSTESLALLANGTVVAWGEGERGQLGDGDEQISSVPEPVCRVRESPCKAANQLSGVTAIAAGDFFDLALLSDGTVVGWGVNASGQLGTGTTSGPETCGKGASATACSRVPVAVSGLTGASAIAAGESHALALLQDGEAMAWGANSGALGDGTTTNSSVPVTVCAQEASGSPCGALTGVRSIAAGSGLSLALLAGGGVDSWGENGSGELGDGSTARALAPVPVSGIDDAVSIAAGGGSDNGFAVLADGSVMGWGANGEAALGDGSPSNSELPTPVSAPWAAGACPDGPYLQGDVAAIAAGGEQVLLAF